jgi:hypothetical protein
VVGLALLRWSVHEPRQARDPESVGPGVRPRSLSESRERNGVRFLLLATI